MYINEAMLLMDSRQCHCRGEGDHVGWHVPLNHILSKKQIYLKKDLSDILFVGGGVGC